MKKHNKLVRDLIPVVIARNGGIARTRRLDSDEEYVAELANKLIEESHEVRETPTLEELADVKEVLEALITANGFTIGDVEEAQRSKATSHGKFDERIYLIDTEG